jgi:DNA-binding transcriptional MerR regulator
MELNYSIQSISLLSGISTHTLRAWERRYQAILPQRAANGRRVYSPSDLEKLKILHQLVQEGHPIGSIAHLSLTELVQLSPQSQKEPPSPQLPAGSFESAILSLKNFRLDQLHQELSRARMNYSGRNFVLHFVSPLMQEVGNQVQLGHFSIAQEHALSALLRDQLSQVYLALNPHRHPPTHFILCTPEGDLHEFGIYLSAILCASYDFSVAYLGPNLPVRDLISAMHTLQAKRVILGSTPSSLHSFKQLERYLTELHEALPREVEIWIGGTSLPPQLPGEGTRTFRLFHSLGELDQTLSSFER